MTVRIGMDIEHHPFLRAIAADPADLMVRDVYRDWLDDRDDPRGEFIHVQCALAEHLQKTSYDMHQCGRVSPHFYEFDRLTDCDTCQKMAWSVDANWRELELRTAHEADWRQVVCPTCAGSGKGITDGKGKPHFGCPDCEHTGDISALTWEVLPLLDEHGAVRGDKACTVHFRRGHVAVVECPYSCAFLPADKPTKVAKQWFTWHPIEEVRLTDREPQDYGQGDYYHAFGWGNRPGMHMPSDLSPLLWDAVSKSPDAKIQGHWADFLTGDKALTALARAAADLIRAAVRSEVSPTTPAF